MHINEKTNKIIKFNRNRSILQVLCFFWGEQQLFSERVVTRNPMSMRTYCIRHYVMPNGFVKSFEPNIALNLASGNVHPLLGR